MSQEANQFEISDPPSDGISAVQWFHHSNHLVASSWDKSLSLYKMTESKSSDNDHQNGGSELVHRYCHDAGVLDCAVSADDLTIFSGGCDNRLCCVDVQNLGSATVMGQHSAPIRSVECCGNTVLSGSWDKTVKIWDLNSKQCTATLALPDKLFAMSTALSSYRLICGIAGRIIYIYDLRNLKEPQQKRESSLKHQTRNIECHPNGEQYVVSSIEGRVAVEYFDPSPPVQAKKYAFKCHRVTDKTTGFSTIYPVNALAFHPLYKTFASGGGDGVVNIWDGDNKKRICQFPAYNTSIASLNFNRDGSLVAIASSYTWEHGDKVRPSDAIWIRRVKESEAKPKIKKQGK